MDSFLGKVYKVIILHEFGSSCLGNLNLVLRCSDTAGSEYNFCSIFKKI